MRIASRFGAAVLTASAAIIGIAVAPHSLASVASATAGKGPIGWDVYRQLDRTDQIPVGVQTKQFSSFDRTGGNADYNRCLSTLSNGSCVLAQADGPGEIDSIWSTVNNGNVTGTGNITVVLDGKTVLHAPFQSVVNGSLGAPFVYPIVGNADQSSGGVYIDAPMTYRTSMQVYTDHDPNYYQVTYRRFADATGVTTFDPTDKALDVIATLQAAGTQDPKPAAAGATTAAQSFDLAPGTTEPLATLTGPGAVSALRVQVPQLVPPTSATDDGRAFGAGGYSQFTVKIDPNNQGVRLIRRADDGIGHQRADVYVDGVKVATWSPNNVAGSCRWSNEAVNLPASATAGKSAITIRNVFVSSDVDFNEFRYTADSNVGGQLVQTDAVNVGANHTADESRHQYSIGKQTWQGYQTFCYPADATANQAVLNSNDVVQHVHVRVSVDGLDTVDAPLGEFFGNGQNDGDVQSLMSSMGAGLGNWFSSWWPMPYASSISISLYNGSSQTLTGAQSQVTSAPDPTVATDLASGTIAHFHTTSHAGATAMGQDWNWVHANGTGKFVGVTQDMTGPTSRLYLEGDERAYVDGSHSPQIHGTGTEDFFRGGWYFNRQMFSDPFTGNPSHMAGTNGCPANTDCTVAYRQLIADAVPFSSGLTFGIEHGQFDEVPANYGTTAFWYGDAADTERVTDTVDVGNTTSEQAHGYTPLGTASTLTDTYEGNDGAAVPITDDLRTATSATSFTVAVDPANRGVVLRRTSNQTSAGQAISVAVDGQSVGTWSQPLGNTSHRWLDDTFYLPTSVTQGKSQLKVTLTPVSGKPAWTAARYVVQSLVAPFTDTTAPGAISGLAASASTTNNTVTLSWAPATDDVGVDHYDVYGSNSSTVSATAANYLGSSAVPGFVDTGVGLKQARYYVVVPVDGAGNTGPVSSMVSVTTGATMRLEAEQLLPAVDANATADAQASCCGVTWSAGAQLWLHASGANQHVTLAFTVPTTGTYAIGSTQTHAPDYGRTTLAVDGSLIGSTVDGYHSGSVTVATVSDGQRSLAAGRHTITLTVTGKNSAASNYLAGLDYLTFQRVA